MPRAALPRSLFARATRALPATYWYLWTGVLVNRLGSFVLPFLSLYLTQQRHLSISDAGWIVSTYGVGSTLAGPVGGALADRFGRRATLLLSLAGGGLLMIALGLAHALWAIAALTFGVSLFTDMSRPAVSAAIADVVAPEERTRAYGYLYWAINLGFSVALVLAGLLSKLGYLALFVTDGLTTLAYAGIVLLKVPETHGPAARSAPEARQGSLGQALRDPVLMTFVVLSLLLGSIYMQSMVSLPLDLTAHGFSGATYGALLAINGVVIVTTQPFLLGPMRRFRRGRLLAFSCVLTGLGFAWNAWSSGVVMYAAGIVLWTLGEIASSSISPAVIADLAPPSLRGRYQGLFAMSWGLGTFAGPAAGAWTLGHLGAKTLWLGCGALGLALALGHLAISPARRRRLERLGLGHTEDALPRIKPEQG